MTGPVTALVTGASGFIGQALVARLTQSGHRVVVLTRNAQNLFPAGVQSRVGDLATGAGVSPELFDGVGTVFHCAGEVKDAARMRQVHVGGTQRLLECLSQSVDRQRRPVHWVQLSSVGAYGPPAVMDRSRQVDEDTQENPVGAYETSKTESDRLIIQAARAGLLSHSILRPSNVIGARMPNASLRAMIAMIGRRRFVYIGKPGAVATYVHVDDVVSALAECARNPAAQGQTFNLSSDCLLEELVERAAKILGVRPPRLRLPEPLMRAAVGVTPKWKRIPLTASRIDALVNRTRYPSTRIESTLGFQFSKPMPAGIDDLIVTGA